jgi:hypothetical protein
MTDFETLFNSENIKIDENGLMDINSYYKLIDYVDNIIRNVEKFDEEFEYNASCGGCALELDIERDLDYKLSKIIWNFSLIVKKLHNNSTQYNNAYKRIKSYIDLYSDKIYKNREDITKSFGLDYIYTISNIIINIEKLFNINNNKKLFNIYNNITNVFT